ncbi:MAG: ATP synthase F1 subunit delta [candidate division Zixibacteria bacterium]|nr:ATP synthase F1 subunit delta [candidate division Zixibacteria bacterium]MCI0596263.1 ATP synthase F1 subunit delta [candidate division Zixibacteria bacterium]
MRKVGEERIARRYAVALFKAAGGKLDIYFDEAKQFLEIWRRESSFSRLLLAPHLLTEEKKAFLERFFKGKVEPVWLGFFGLLIDKGRIGYFPQIVENFILLAEEAKGIMRARVQTAVALSSKDAEALKTKLEKKTGRRILILPEVKPELLGGMVVILKDQIIDGSVRQRLNELREQLLAVKVA